MGIRFHQLYKKHYAIRIEVEDMKRILALDRENLLEGKTLHQLLMEIDHVMDVDYDGMWGPNIFVTIDVTMSEDLKEINRIIESYIAA